MLCNEDTSTRSNCCKSLIELLQPTKCLARCRSKTEMYKTNKKEHARQEQSAHNPNLGAWQLSNKDKANKSLGTSCVPQEPRTQEKDRHYLYSRRRHAERRNVSHTIPTQARCDGGRGKSNGGGILLPGQKTHQRYSKASLGQRKGNCQPATSFRVQGCCFFGCAPFEGGAQQSLPTKTGKVRGQANCAGTHSETPPPRKAQGCGRAAKVSRAKCLLKSKSVTRK